MTPHSRHLAEQIAADVESLIALLNERRDGLPDTPERIYLATSISFLVETLDSIREYLAVAKPSDEFNFFVGLSIPRGLAEIASYIVQTDPEVRALVLCISDRTSAGVTASYKP